MALKQYFYIVLVPLKFIPKRTASFWQTIKIPNRFVLKICTGGFADYMANVGIALCSLSLQSEWQHVCSTLCPWNRLKD